MSRWHKHGRDRLYVNDDATREGVGFYDYETGRLALKDANRTMEVLEALRPFLADTVAPVPDGPVPQREQPQQPGSPLSLQPLQRLQPESGPARNRLGALFSRKPGARNERMVGKRLGRLRRDGWTVLSPIARRGGRDIDHLVVGPPGVFTVTAKTLTGAIVQVGEEAVTLDGTQRPYLRESRREAAAAERILTSAAGLPVPVTPVLAFVGAASIDAQGSRGDVLVLPGEDIDTILRERVAVHSIQERERIVAAARRAEIWLS